MADVYEGKSLQDLMQEIVTLTAHKRTTINSIISELRQFVTNAEDAAVFAPIIKDFLDVSVKNDDSLVKVGTIVQRIVASEKTGGGSIEDLLSDEEKSELVRAAQAQAISPNLQNTLNEALSKKNV